jgi:hypothetical protein
MFYAISEEYTSLNQLSHESEFTHPIEISKQGLHDKFSASSVSFSKQLLSEALSHQIRLVPAGADKELFRRVLVKDSTSFQLDSSLKDDLPGSGGSNSGAEVCIQFEYDLKTGKINDIEITPKNRNDATDAEAKKEKILPSDLVIRDLGYFKTGVFSHIIKEKAYFITRLHSTINVYEDPAGNSLLDFEALYRDLSKNKIERVEKDVFIGTAEKLPVRLVIAMVPEEVYQSRIRKRKNRNKNIGKTRKSKSKTGEYTISDKTKIRAHFNLYITNIPSRELSLESVCNLYTARWQIEMMFKVWKSILKIHRIGKMNYHRLMTRLYMSLLWIVVHWGIISSYGNYLYRQQHRLLSVYKCMNTLRTYNQYIRLLLRMNRKKLGKMLRKLLDVLSERHWLEQVKNKRSYQEIIELIFCKSKNYA